MEDDEPAGLSPTDELELLRRREAESERKRHAKMNALLRADYRAAKAESAGEAKQGDLLPTRAMVEAKRAELIAAGEHHGYGPLAVALGVSIGVVRRRLGK